MTLRSLTFVIAMVVVVVGWSSLPAHAATDLEKAEKAVGKSAQVMAELPGKPKGMCVCRSSTNTPIIGKAGFMRRGRLSIGGGNVRITVDCWIYDYDANGNAAGATSCVDFQALPD